MEQPSLGNVLIFNVHMPPPVFVLVADDHDASFSFSLGFFPFPPGSLPYTCCKCRQALRESLDCASSCSADVSFSDGTLFKKRRASLQALFSIKSLASTMA